VGHAHAAQPATAARRIDVHHHFLAPDLATRIEDVSWARPILNWTPQASLETMDRAGIATAILSGMTGYGAAPLPRQEAAFRARVNNGFGARLVSDHRGRFGLFATLPLPYIDESLEEIGRSLDTLGADGVFLWTSYGDRWLGDPAFEVVLAELNRRRAVVLTHPLDAPCCVDLQPDTAPQVVEWNTQTSRAIWSMLNDGPTGRPHPSPATRFPDIRFIWPHAGGSLLGLAGRFVGSELVAEGQGRPPAEDSRLYHLRRFHYDTAAAFNRVEMPALKALVGTSRIVFGSDAPFVNPSVVAGGLAGCGFSPGELRAVERDNALGLLPRWG
jgi:predicted TIM-barrel fold metal-dependent hydrolase